MGVSKSLAESLRYSRLNQVLPKALETISTIIRRPVVSFNVESALSEEMFEKFLHTRSLCREGNILHFRLLVSQQERPKMSQVLEKLRMCNLELPMWIYRVVGQDVVAVETTHREILGHAFELVSIDDDTLHVATEDFSHAVELEYYLERIPGYSREVYQLIVWGEEFIKVLVSEWENGVGELRQALSPW